jgi:hypothetical protein
MIVRCRKDVFICSKSVLFKATEYAKVTVANIDFFLLWLGWLFRWGARGEGWIKEESKF